MASIMNHLCLLGISNARSARLIGENSFAASTAVLAYLCGMMASGLCLLSGMITVKSGGVLMWNSMNFCF